MEEHHQFDVITKCVANLTADQIQTVNLINTMIDLVCAITIALMLAVLIFFKAYSTVLQRLFLYLIIASVLRALISFSSIEHQGYYSGQDIVCEMLGFLVNWADFIVCFLALQIIVYMVFQVYCLTQGNPFYRVVRSNCRQQSLEFAYVSLSVLGTFLYALGPFFHNDYGLSDDGCWIQSVRLDENCTYVDVFDQVVFGYAVFEGVGVVGVFLLIFVAIFYFKLTSSLHDARVLLKKTLIVLIIFLLYISILVFPFVFNTHSSVFHRADFGTWVIKRLIFPIDQLLLTCGFFIGFFSLNVKSFRRAAKEWRCCHSFSKCCSSCQKRHDCDANSRLVVKESSVNYAGTSPASTRVSQPSNTFFKPPYTDDFTNISVKLSAEDTHIEGIASNNQ